MKKKVLILVAVAAMTLISLSYLKANHTVAVAMDKKEGGGGSSTECNLCVVKQFGVVKFSCSPTQDIHKCNSPAYLGATVSCANATKCE